MKSELLGTPISKPKSFLTHLAIPWRIVYKALSLYDLNSGFSFFFGAFVANIQWQLLPPDMVSIFEKSLTKKLKQENKQVAHMKV